MKLIYSKLRLDIAISHLHKTEGEKWAVYNFADLIAWFSTIIVAS